MSKELSAREWIETNEVANLDLPDGTNEMDVEGKVKELCIAFGESYATARLEAYKAGLREWVQNEAANYNRLAEEWKNESDTQSFYYKSKMSGYQDVLSYLNDTPDPTEAEQNCGGCMGPCKGCESKKD